MMDNKKNKPEETPKEKEPVLFTECVICGCTPRADEWSAQVENACIDCM